MCRVGEQRTIRNGCRSIITVVAIVANWDSTRVFLKATGGLSQPGNSPVYNSIVFALFQQKYVV